MTPCLDEPTLLAVASGDAGAAARTHTAQCRGCATRLTALRADLAVLRDTLADGPLPAALRRMPTRHYARGARTRSWASPFATAGLAAAALLALVWWRTPQTPTASARPQLATLTGDVSAALFASREGLSLPEPRSDRAYLAAALDGGWPCDARTAYGSGCDYADLLYE